MFYIFPFLCTGTNKEEVTIENLLKKMLFGLYIIAIKELFVSGGRVDCFLFRKTSNQKFFLAIFNVYWCN